MTTAAEYSYIGDGFSLNIDSSLMTRAVRVKSMVKDKLKRIFEKNVVVTEEPQVSNEAVETVTEQSKESLIDISNENLDNLNQLMNSLILQDNVPYVASRAVLFTKPLFSKIERVTNKWFKDMPILEKTLVSNEVPSVEANSEVVNVVPGTWDDVNEMTPQNLDLVSEPEAVPTVEEKTDISVPVPEVNVSVSEIEVPEPQVEVDAPVVENNVPEEKEVSNDFEVPSFMPNMDELIPSSNPSVDENDVELQQVELVPEPTTVSEENSFVAEPTTIQNEEPAVPSVEVAEPTIVSTSEVQQEDKHEEVSKELAKSEFETGRKMTVEEKIAELIERKRKTRSEEEPEVKAVSEQEPNEEEDKKLETKTELTQAGVIARLQRLNNTMKDKDATIRSLTAKVDAAKEETVQAKEKISGYEAVVNDLTVKNNTLAKENERLSQRVEEAENASQSTISKLEAQVNELTKSKMEESENSKKLIAELKERHAKEIAELKEKHAAELKAVSDTKERQIQAIYATISEALGETPTEEDYDRSMAA